MRESKFYEFRMEPDDSSWKVIMYDLTRTPEDAAIGYIEGDIIRDKEKTVFVIGQSELDEAYRGKGLGRHMYVNVIKKCLLFCDEFRSSNSLNNYSKGVWNSLRRDFHNVCKKGMHYEITKNKKEILQ